MEMFYPMFVTLIVMIFTALIIFGAKMLNKKFDIKPEEITNTLDMTKLIATFIGNTLKDNNLKQNKIDELLPLIMNALDYIKITVLANPNTDISKDALDMVKELAEEYDVKITEDEYLIIHTALKLANNFYISYVTHSK